MTQHAEGSRCADVVPFCTSQPRPMATHIVRSNGVTAIARLWAKEDAARCQLCPTCVAGPQNLCLVQVAGHIADADAPLFRSPPPPRGKMAGGST